MKRSTLKLAIRHETLRVLAELDLAHVAGGSPVEREAMNTGGSPGQGCVQAAIVPPNA